MFKILTIAMALDSGRVSLRERFDATGKLRIGRHRIGDDHAENRWLSVPRSSSTLRTSAAPAWRSPPAVPPLEEFFRRVGFDAAPEIEIAEAVQARTPERWAEVTVATTSFGHGIAVSPLQFLDAVAGVVGDGHAWPRPC